MNWRAWFGALYAEDVIRWSPKLTLTLGFREETSNGWNEPHGRAANYTFSNRVISSQPHIGTALFTKNDAKFLPQPRIGVAWSPLGNQTVFRAGFGIYDDLQDALGYRTDQNAPFNPTYSLASLPVSKLPIDPAAVSYIPAEPPKANPALANPWTWFSRGDSSYHALQLDLRRRFSRGLSLRGVYTYSKIIDDGDSVNQTTAGNAPGLVSNPFNLRADKGLATFDVRHAAVINAIYALPFGQGQYFGGNLQGCSNKLLTDSSVSVVLNAQSGFAA